MPDNSIASETHAGVAVVTITSPPVNTLNRSVRRGLLEALRAAESDKHVRAVVITGTGTFSAGADLAEFDSGEGLAEPSLHLTISGFLDDMSTPSVAAISGVALGGGLELALACSARVAEPSARLGLPETTLGFMPGAGGTQRLPRAVGIEQALDLIVTGRSVSGTQAAEIGLVDELADDVVVEAARVARQLADGERPRRRLRDESITEPLATAIVDAAQRNARRAPTATDGIRRALDAVQASVSEPFDTGLATEFRLFTELAGRPEAKAARYRFLSEHGRTSRRLPAPRPVTTAAVIGAGTMGRGIVIALLAAGIHTTLIDTTDEALSTAADAIGQQATRAVRRGRMSAEEAARLAELLTTTTRIESVAKADLVIEAVFEDLSVKLGVFAALNEYARPGAVLATNTSSLDIDVIASSTGRPQDVVGMHFFSPADVMRLVEVVEGSRTSEDALATALAVTKRIRKLAVVAQVGPGFIGNRIFDAYLRQANLLLSAGVRPERIDGALENWGMAMGPFRVLDLVGNDVPWKARRGKPADPAWQWADAVVEQGWYGRKSGIGWYDYGTDRPVANPGLDDMLPTESVVKDDEIVERCILALVNEAAAVLDGGIAASPADIDTVLVNGYGFPARRGGPWFWAEGLGWESVTALMRNWAEAATDLSLTPHSRLTCATAPEVIA